MAVLIGLGIGALLVMLIPLLGVVVGGFSGWVVGGFFPEVIDTINHVLGTELTDFEVGGTLGFVGGFFRSYVNKETKTKE